MRWFIVVFLVLSVMMSSQVYAGPKVYVYGSGANSCGKYVKALEGFRKQDVKDTMEYLSFITWFSGFVSSKCLDLDKDVLHGKDFDGITLWFENYCREHPLDGFYTATIKLLGELDKK